MKIGWWWIFAISIWIVANTFPPAPRERNKTKQIVTVWADAYLWQTNKNYCKKSSSLYLSPSATEERREKGRHLFLRWTSIVSMFLWPYSNPNTAKSKFTQIQKISSFLFFSSIYLLVLKQIPSRTFSTNRTRTFLLERTQILI